MASSCLPVMSRGPCIGSMDHPVVPSKPCSICPMPLTLMRIMVLFGRACEISRSPATPCAAISNRPLVRTDECFAITGAALVAATNFAMRSFAGGSVAACARPRDGTTLATIRAATATRMGFPVCKADMKSLLGALRTAGGRRRRQWKYGGEGRTNGRFRGSPGARPSPLEPLEGRGEWRVASGLHVACRQRDHLIRHRAPPLDSRTVSGHEIRDDVHEDVARREPGGDGRQRLTGRPLAEQACPA